MKRNITFSADELVIGRAREMARRQKTPLNIVFRRWIEAYAAAADSADKYDQVMEKLRYAKAGRRFSREELNER